MTVENKRIIIIIIIIIISISFIITVCMNV